MSAAIQKRTVKYFVSYARAADLLLEQWDTHRMLAADVEIELGRVIIDQKDKRDLLRDLAWKMQTGQRGLRGNLISKEAVESAMDTAFQHRIIDAGLRRKAINLLIDKLTQRNYILCHVGGAQFAFVHRGFLEFFTSEYLINIITQRPETAIDEIGKIYQTYGDEDAWREVLILAATRFEPSVADKILRPFVENADGESVGYAAYVQHHHPFTLVCSVISRAREPQKLAKISVLLRASLEGWIRQRPDYINGDGWVSLIVENFPDVKTRTLLAELARREENTAARREAVSALAEHFGDAETRTLLAELARREENTVARGEAVSALAEHFRDTETRTLLAELARHEENTDARREAVRALAEHFGDAETEKLLLDVAAIPPGYVVIEKAANYTINERQKEYLSAILKKKSA